MKNNKITMKKLGFLITFVGLSLGISAQNQSQYTGALLWKVSGKDLKKPSYIVGTHHAVPVSYVDSIRGLKRTLKQVKQVVGEIELLNSAKITGVMIQFSQMPAGHSYKSVLSDEEYSLLDKALSKNLGMGLNKLENIHPATISTMLGQKICMQLFPEMRMPNFEPIDMYVQKIAHNQKKNVAGLETAEEQFEILYNSEPIEKQIKDLLCFIKDMDEQRDNLMEITEFYYQKQLDKIYEQFYKDLGSDGDCVASETSLLALNSNRNDKWLTILPQIMKKKPSLIAVGAGHLGGESGLLQKLDKMGYTITPVIE